MKKVLIDYDPATGQLHDANGMCIGTWTNLYSFPYEENPPAKTDDMVKLVQAGFDQDDVIQMLREKLI